MLRVMGVMKAIGINSDEAAMEAMEMMLAVGVDRDFRSNRDDRGDEGSLPR